MRGNLVTITLVSSLFFGLIHAQENALLYYYLPDESLNPAVSTPAAFLGYDPGEWHLTHDQLLFYMKKLADESDRVLFQEYARSHEGRPLFQLVISSPENISKIEQIRTEHLRLADPKISSSVEIKNLPSVVSLNYTVHGNEPSGVNASVYVAYYLAASQGKYVDSLLKDVVVLIDPCLNPDGMHRFANWVNAHKGQQLISDPASRELNEPWPGSRSNHYWFDLNRDYLPLVHPESRGRVRRFHEWLPNIYCDYHEMGTNSTYFFQPGVPERTNPLTPQKNQELTEKVATYHASFMDKIGSLYYSKEDFDDFYYGKGSTYPDIHGSIGILFEQASSRGHLQDSRNGKVSFPFTIRNQITTSLSSLRAGFDLREELLEWKRNYFKDAMDEAARHPVKAYVFKPDNDVSRSAMFLDLLINHQIEVYQLASNVRAGNKSFSAESYIVPMDQRQHRLIRTLFDTTTVFKDSLFYDISTWTFSLGMNVDFAPLTGSQYTTSLKGALLDMNEIQRKPEKVLPAKYAWFIENDDIFSASAFYYLLQQGMNLRLVTEPMSINTQQGKKRFGAGTVIISAVTANGSSAELDHLQYVTNKWGIRVWSSDSGRATEGVDLGSPSIQNLRLPKMVLLTGTGSSAQEAGEIWHTLDKRLGMKVTLLDVQQFDRLEWKDYTHLFITGAPTLNESQTQILKSWIQEGGIVIATGRGNNWLKSQKLAFLEDPAPEKEETINRISYADYESAQGASRLNGAILEMEIDTTHPLFYGYKQKTIAVFHSGTQLFEATRNPLATPGYYSKKAILSGYVPRQLKDKIAGKAAVVVSGHGSGKVISLLDNPVFRGYWTATFRLFTNSIFNSSAIMNGATERSFRKTEE
ncbi:MAG: zinc carboxypeptidase [Saprospiraceae bacterium]|nr:zinc carboxypeptidase [Saprospiraceae bacterium]